MANNDIKTEEKRLINHERSGKVTEMLRNGNSMN